MSETGVVPVAVRPLWWGEPSMGEGNFVLPTGTVTLLLGDVEGSTRTWEADAREMTGQMAQLNRVVDEQVGRHDGVRPVEQGEGDSFVAAFSRCRDAVGAALAIQRQLAGWPIRLRLGVHAGDVQHRDEGNYAGPTVNRAARLRDLAHGGQSVLSQAAADLAADALPEGASLRDLGSHRLKDLSRPERVFQLCHPDLGAEFPPLRSLDARAHNLPVQRTSFVGRQREMTEVKRLISESALVCLVGSGGCGKTRLAVHTGAEMVDDFADGVWLADLAAVADPADVATQVASVFALKQGPGMTATDALTAYLADKQALLILDNCEHVIDAAAPVADTLVGTCPSLRVLATSRQPLNLPGEMTWRVPSMEVPTTDQPAAIAGLPACEAVQLFADRANRVRPGFAVTDANAAPVAAICRRLDGIPLAIELAAARVRVLSPAQIAQGLDERFGLLTGAPRTALPRQQTLEASVDWSHHLLTDLEQTVLRRLAVFAAGFDYPAAQQVCGFDPIQPHQVLDLLTLLVDKSLVDVDDSGAVARYRLLETVRAYSWVRLESSSEAPETRDRHRDHYLAVSEEAEAYLEGYGQAEWISLLARDYPNLRAALSWSREQADSEALARIAASLSLFWAFHGPNNEGATWLVAADCPTDIDPCLRARVLLGRAYLACAEVDHATDIAVSEEGLRLARQIGDNRLAIRLAGTLGAGRSLTACVVDPILEEGIALARKTGDRFGLALVLHQLGLVYNSLDPPRARPYLEEARQLAIQSGNRVVAGWALGGLGRALWHEGDLRQAITTLELAVDEGIEIGDRLGVTLSLLNLTWALIENDELAQALEVADRLESSSREGGLGIFLTIAPACRSQVALAAGDHDVALQIVLHALPHMNAIPITHALALMALVEAELTTPTAEQAGAQLDETLELFASSGDNFYRPAVLALKARLARLRGDPDAAYSHADQAIDSAIALGAKARIVDGLEVLAGLATDAGNREAAARLFGAADRAREDTGYRRCVSERDADLDALRAALGGDEFDAADNEGRSLTLEGAVAYAKRSRGRRKRPPSGWASLTPSEIQVAALVREGLGNAEIARRLLCSPRTVQAHLTHIFAKLGLSTRTELALQPPAKNCAGSS